MRRFLFSLWFRLVLGFGLILAATLFSVSFYISKASEREAAGFERQQETVRRERAHRLIVRTLSVEESGATAESHELQTTLERVGPAVGRRIVVLDKEGNVVGDSARRSGHPGHRWKDRGTRRPIVVEDRQVGFIEFGPAPEGEEPDDPQVSNLVSSLNAYLLWAGVAGGLGGVVLASLVSRQILAPVKALGTAANRLGRGDLSIRADTRGPAEIQELADSFNRMAGSLQSAEAQRRSLVADVAHELRTPLANIQGYLEAVRDGLLEPDEQTIDTIHGQVLHLGRLVEDLRLLARAEGGSLPLDMEPDSLPEVVGRAVNAARPRAEANSIQLDYGEPEEPVLALMDRTRIAQVVSNLLDNALQHTPEGGRVEVSLVLLEGDRVRVAVTDNGEGIPEEDLQRIFDRFYRVDSSRSRASGGAGLGLTIVKGLVEAHGGSVGAESPSHGGTRVWFELARFSGDPSSDGGSGQV